MNKATRALFRLADTPEKMLALGEDKVRDHIKSIGLYRNKARNVIALSQKLIELYGSEVPKDGDALETLPGVGRKTANVVMNVAFGAPTMAVDTHVFRVSHRLGLSNGKNPLEVEADLLAIVPPEYGVHAHHWLILHGRYVCLARKPRCPACIVRDLCPFPDKTPPADAGALTSTAECRDCQNVAPLQCFTLESGLTDYELNHVFLPPGALIKSAQTSCGTNSLQ